MNEKEWMESMEYFVSLLWDLTLKARACEIQDLNESFRETYFKIKKDFKIIPKGWDPITIKDLTKEISDYVLEKFGEWYSWEIAPKALMYIVSECGEAHEAWRDDNKEQFNEELADMVIRIFDTAYWHGCDLEAEIRKKMDVNWKRPQNHGRVNV